ALQVVISGLVAVVIADLIATGASAQRLVAQGYRPERHLQGYAFHAFILVATLPVLLLAAADGQITAAKQETDGGGRLHEAVSALSDHIAAYVSDHQHAVQALAAAIGPVKTGGTTRQALLDQYHAIYPGFITLFVADGAGVVHEIYPRRDDESPPISDREYFLEAVKTRTLAMSDVIVGRLSHVPIVTIA